jgi:hypothetical protein
MPKATTKKRQDLRSSFSRNAIPSEGDFADLIAAGLNQAEGGLLKLPDQCLGLVRQKPDAPILSFFADSVAGTAAWQMQLIDTDKPSFGLSKPSGDLALFLDGTTGHVGIGTTHASHQLTVEGRWPDSQAPGSKLSKQGILAIKSKIPQLDFRDTEPTAKDWAIHVRNNKLSFIRSPWEATDLVLDGEGNVGIGTDSPSQKLHVEGNVRVGADLAVAGNLNVSGRMRGEIRSVWYEMGSGWVPNSSGRVVSRTLTIEKKNADTVLRILYSDNTMVDGAGNSARWEIRLKDQPLKSPIFMDRYDAVGANFYVHSTIVGYVHGLAPKTYEIQVWVVQVPNHPYEVRGIGTGGYEAVRRSPDGKEIKWAESSWCLEAEEIYQKTL